MRAAARCGALLLLFLACLGPHLLSLAATGRSRWPRRFLSGVARLCGMRVTTVGEPVAAYSLIVANHLSWLDIPILAGATGCAFVSKEELRGNQLLGWLADQNDTLYVHRQQRGEARAQVEAVAKALGRARPLALFPEGTTGDGRALLPFRSALLAAVAPPPNGVAVRPVAIDYGAAAPRIGWSNGESGGANLLRVLGRRGTLPVIVRLLAPLPPGSDRKQLAAAAQAAVQQALAASGAARPVL